MGSACFVAAKETTIVAARETTVTNGPTSEVVQRNVRYSPSWSFRWDNRRRVAGEETMNWLSDGASRSGGLGVKSGTTVETAYASEEGSPLDSSQILTSQRSPISERNSGNLRLPSSDQSHSTSVQLEVKEPTESPAVSDPSSMKLSPSVHSISSLSTSPLSSQNHLLPASPTPSSWSRPSPGHQVLRQVSDSRIPGRKSPNFSISEEPSFMFPRWSNESNGASNRGSSDGWSLPAFSELMANSHRERWSFDSESLGFNMDKITRSSSRFSSSVSIDMRTCGVCSKLLTEKSSWGSQKIIATNELAVVAVLVCGHVYHAECLENMTPEINKYDPACPVCTFGEKQVLKLTEKALRAEMDAKSKNKRWRSQIASRDIDGHSGVIEGRKSGGIEGKGLKMVSSPSMKSSFGKPFLKRHFSFGSKGARSFSDNHPTRKKAFFWSKSSKE